MDDWNWDDEDESEVLLTGELFLGELFLSVAFTIFALGVLLYLLKITNTL